MKRIMILGAGSYQVPLIKKAKSMGLYTIVASIPGNYPGFKYADESLYINTIDKEKILKACKEKDVDGVALCGTDVAIPSLGYCCEHLNLSGPSYKSAVLTQNKAKMKHAFEKAGVRTAEARFIKLDNSYPIEICNEIGFPVIFKSVDSSGSRGITKCYSPSEIDYAYHQVKENTKANEYIIEKYLEGVEFGAQSFVYNNQIKFVLPHGDYIFQGDAGVPIGHYAPFEVEDSILEDIESQLGKAVIALGLNNCAVNADFILNDGKVFVIEIGARAGGTCLPELVSIYYGFDYYEKIIQVALGEEPEFKPLNKIRQPNAELLFISDKDGIIRDILPNKINDERIIDISFDYSVGDKVRKFKKGPDRIGQVIAIGNTVAEAKKVIDAVMNESLIKIS